MYCYLLFYICNILNYKRISIYKILVSIEYLLILTISKVNRIRRIGYYRNNNLSLAFYILFKLL